MSDKKNIDRLFQEKFKDFEATPSNAVWDNISSKLYSTKKSTKRISIWWKAAGIAAALLLLFSIGQLILNDNTTTPSQETIVDIDSEINSSSNNLPNVIDKESVIAEEKSGIENNQSKSFIDNSIDSKTNPANLSKENYSSTSKIKNRNAIVSIKNLNDNNSGANTSKNGFQTSSDRTKNVTVENSTSNMLQGKIKDENVVKIKANELLNNINNPEEASVVIKASLTPYNVNFSLITLLETNEVIRDHKLSLSDAVVANENSENVPEEEFVRWKASSNIAPVYFNTLGKGSSIHPQFNNNSKTGNINMSYGVTGSYAINKKLSIRAGVNKVNLGYSTNNVVVFNNVGASADTQLLRNIELNEAGQNLSFISAEEFNFIQIPSLLSHVIESSVEQKLGFIEIPLELKYNISDKKMGFNLIGGISALFLNENQVFSVLEGESTLLGKATNINNTSFSANLGLGLDFKILDKFNFNLEPVFKYQLNTFNNTSGNFKPFFIGIYSGLSFKF